MGTSGIAECNLLEELRIVMRIEESLGNLGWKVATLLVGTFICSCVSQQSTVYCKES